MPGFSTTKKDYTTLDGLREGARFCKMDLHTHTPASECSSFTLPKPLEDLIPQKPKGKTLQKKRRALLEDIAAFHASCTPLPSDDT